ncbi:MAG TPA: hypothetical protein PLQ35_06070 [bacterium]|nr:hypothetical protein [bacterium]
MRKNLFIVFSPEKARLQPSLREAAVCHCERSVAISPPRNASHEIATSPPFADSGRRRGDLSPGF